MNELQWWCAARGAAWSWEWQAYPGVWAFVAALALVYHRLAWRGDVPVAPVRRASGIAGLLLTWVTLDWPVGALGAGYLTSVHALQFMSLGLVVPLLLLLGVPPARWSGLAARRGACRMLGAVTRPLLTGAFFAVVMVGTHAAPVVDTLMASQLGSFAIDMLWFTAGILFWWPIVVPEPARPAFSPPLRIFYVFLATVPHVFIAMWMLLASLPIYATYELAPPFPGLSPLADQQLAGGVLLLIGSPFIVATISTIFFRWQKEAGDQG